MKRSDAKALKTARARWEYRISRNVTRKLLGRAGRALRWNPIGVNFDQMLNMLSAGVSYEEIAERASITKGAVYSLHRHIFAGLVPLKRGGKVESSFNAHPQGSSALLDSFIAEAERRGFFCVRRQLRTQLSTREVQVGCYFVRVVQMRDYGGYRVCTAGSGRLLDFLAIFYPNVYEGWFIVPFQAVIGKALYYAASRARHRPDRGPSVDLKLYADAWYLLRRRTT